jgi:hypothetical protein
MATLTVNGLVFSGDVSSATGFYFSDLVDWDTIPDSKSAVNERPQAHGAFGIANDYRQSAAISFDAWYNAATRLEMKQAKQLAKVALGTNRPIPVTLDDVDGRMTRYVSVRHAPFDDNKSKLAFTFAVDMVATDPLMYGDPVTVDAGPAVSGGGLTWPLGTADSGLWEDWGADGSSGRVTVTNQGTADAWPVLRVQGGTAGGFVITDLMSGKVVEFDRQIPDGSIVTVNQRTQTASIDGASNDVSGFLTADFFSVPKGESMVIAWAPIGATTGSPRLFVDLSPAYL